MFIIQRPFQVVGRVKPSTGFLRPALLVVAGDRITIRPRKPWSLFMPTLDGPLSAVTMAWKTRSAVRLQAPGDRNLDGLYFRPAGGPDALVGLLEERGVVVQRMLGAQALKRWLQDFAVAHRPGFIWRDQGTKAFVETLVGLTLAVGLGIFLFSSVPSSGLQIAMLAWLGFIALFALVSAIVGHLHRRRLTS